jgi:lambda family phage portal protein
LKTPTLMDRLIAVVNPEAALRRAKSRALLSAIRGVYDGAASRRSNGGWLVPSTSANSEIKPALVRLRDRTRDLVRNNPYATRAVDVWVSHLIGDGITVTPRADDGINPSLQMAWDSWAMTSECDADGQNDFNGIQALMTRSMVESGECLIRFRTRRIEDGLTVPLQLQCLESDFLDHTKTENLPNGGTIVMGVQFGPLGNREGYWLFKNHPGDNFFSYQRASAFVPADQIIHLYRKTRPGQVRAPSWLAAVVNKMRDLDDLDEALLVKAKIESCLAAFVTSTDDEAALGKTDTETDSEGDDRILDSIEPGMVKYLRPGEGIETLEPSGAGNYEKLGTRTLQSIAVGAGITYDQLTGDLGVANYASLRAGKIEFRRALSQVQWQVLVPMLCERVWNQFVMMGGVAGKWKPGVKYPAAYMPPRNEPIDPKKDTDAEVSDVAAGFQSWSDTVRARGKDPAAHAKELADEEKMLKDLGLDRIIPAQSPTTPDQPMEIPQ